MDNGLLMIVLAFVAGYMCSYMIQNMCSSQLVEGGAFDELEKSAGFKCGRGHIDESKTHGKCYSDKDCCGRRICVKYAHKTDGMCQDDTDSIFDKCDYCKGPNEG